MRNGDAYFLGVGGYDGTNAAAAASMPLAAAINAKADISAASKVIVKDPSDQEYADGKKTDLSVIKIPADEYYALVSDEDVHPNALYVISGDYINAYG